MKPNKEEHARIWLFLMVFNPGRGPAGPVRWGYPSGGGHFHVWGARHHSQWDLLDPVQPGLQPGAPANLQGRGHQRPGGEGHHGMVGSTVQHSYSEMLYEYGAWFTVLVMLYVRYAFIFAAGEWHGVEGCFVQMYWSCCAVYVRYAFKFQGFIWLFYSPQLQYI